MKGDENAGNEILNLNVVGSEEVIMTKYKQALIYSLSEGEL